LAIQNIKRPSKTIHIAGLRQARKRIKLEMENGDGDKISIIFEGSLNREKLFQLADFLELVGGTSEPQVEVKGSKLAKIIEVIEKNFPFSFFTSRDVVEAYEYEFREPIALSTVSTYLARLAERGFLERAGAGNFAKYRVIHSENRVRDVASV